MNVAIVEDNTSSAKNLQSHLARFEKETGIDIRSSVYRDGIDFIANYASQWDLVLMDIEMPVLDGMHTAKKLRLFNHGRYEKNRCENCARRGFLAQLLHIMCYAF